jgi:predicted permease
MENFAHDVRFALRTFRRLPAFTAIAVITLAIGIGANTAVFSILYAVLLRPLPFHDAGSIMSVSRVMQNGSPVGLSWPEFDSWRQRISSFEMMALYRGGAGDLIGGGEPERIVVASVSRGFFPLLGVTPLAGRTFDQETLPPDGLQPAVISEMLWRDRFGGRPDVLGQSVQIMGQPYTIVGVMPRTMGFPWRPQAWVPLDGTQTVGTRTARKYHVIARLKPGVDPRAAFAELSAVAAAEDRAYQEKMVKGVELVPLREQLTGAMRVTLWLLFAMATFVLLIACANTATLLLSRERSRAGEVAMRAALGATPGRIIRQLLTESVLLSLFGAAAGMIAAVFGARAMLRYPPVQAAVGDAPLLSAGVLLFALGASVLTALLFGAAPALRLARADLATLTRQASSQRASRDLLRQQLVTAEVMLAVLLLAPAGLMTRSLLRLNNEPLGFQPERMLVVGANVPAALKERWVAYYDQLLERLGNLPGAEGVAASTELPLTREKGQASIIIEGRWAPGDTDRMPASWNLVNDGYFRTMGVPILRGRGFQSADRGGIKVAVISRTMADRYWPGGDAIGARIATPGLNSDSYERVQAGTPDWITIVGIAADVRSGGAAAELLPELYLPYFQYPGGGTNLSIAIRTSLPVAAMEQPVKQAIHTISPVVPVRMRTYETMIDDRFATSRLRSLLIRLFAVLALVLVVGGVYGVTSYWVEQRRREIGIRIALGATPRELVLLFVRRGMTAASIGVAAGAIGAVWLTRFVASFLYKTSPTDPVVFGTAAVIALVSTLVATLLPARRATSVAPARALRSE